MNNNSINFYFAQFKKDIFECTLLNEQGNKVRCISEVVESFKQVLDEKFLGKECDGTDLNTLKRKLAIKDKEIARLKNQIVKLVDRI